MTVCFLLLSHYLWWSVAQKQQPCYYWWGSLINNSAIHLISQWDWWWSFAPNPHTSILFLAPGRCYLFLPCLSAFSVFVSVILSVALATFLSLSVSFLIFNSLLSPMCLFLHFTLLSPIHPITLCYRSCMSHCIVFGCHCYTCNWLPLCPESVPLTSTGGQCLKDRHQFPRYLSSLLWIR